MKLLKLFRKTLTTLLLITSSTLFAQDSFQTIMEEHWQWVLQQNPAFATSLGIRDYDDRLEDPSLQAYQQSIEKQQHFIERLQALNVRQLSQADELNYQLLLLELQNNVEASKFGGKYMLLTNRNGPHINATGLPNRLPFFTIEDYESYIARLRKIPEYMKRATKRIQAGLEQGWVQPCESMRGYEKSITAHLVSDARQSALYKPLQKLPESIDEKQSKKLRNEASKAIKKVVKSLQNFHQFYIESYQPNCQQQVGTDKLPDGKAYYQHRVKLFTTTNRSADDIHQIGLDEVARIRAEMLDIIVDSGFEGSFKDFQTMLRNDKSLYPKTAEQRMTEVARILKQMDGLLPELFTQYPRVPYGIKEIPLDIAEKTTTAYYQPPAGDGSRAGFYYVNTSKLDTRPLHELEALSLHEAVPGHHFQIALAQELDLPPFRRYGGFTAFVEGWGLYAERLGLEVGFYQTALTNFGRLSYEMWRACRLVVDTGMHSKNWTRQQAIDYMLENTGLSENNIVTEVDRYITWPGQALAYKMGELKIRELRAYAEKELGTKFDKRYFHDAILENGAIPLSMLERHIYNWVASNQ